MNPLPPPVVPGSTDWARFDTAVSMVLKVPKEAFLASEVKKQRASTQEAENRKEDQLIVLRSSDDRLATAMG